MEKKPANATTPPPAPPPTEPTPPMPMPSPATPPPLSTPSVPAPATTVVDPLHPGSCDHRRVSARAVVLHPDNSLCALPFLPGEDARHTVVAIGHPVSAVDACKLRSMAVVYISRSRSRPPFSACCGDRVLRPYLYQLHLFSFLVYVLIFLYLLLSYHTCMATGLHSDRDARLSCPLPFSACIVSVVLVTYVPFRQLLLRRWIDDVAFIWDIGSSFYLRQRQQHHLSVAGMCLLRWLIRFPINRRNARSIHLGARVLDASAYSPRWLASLPRRLSRRCCLYFWSQDLVVSRYPLNLIVLSLL